MQEPEPSVQGGFPWRLACGLAALIATLSMMTMAQANHHEDDPLTNQVISGSAFGYADAPGRQVLVPVETALARGMKQFRKAVAAPGRVVDLTYGGAQRAGDGGAGPQTPQRFADTPGAVFAANQPVGEGGDVLVATEAFLAERQVLRVTPARGDDCSPAMTSLLTARSGRDVAWCRKVADVEGGGSLSLARFAPRGRDELVTLAYAAPGEKTVFLDHPASADPGGTWKPDDGGEFFPENYRPLFAFRTRAGLELAVRWSGPDGDSMDLYRQDGEALVPFVAASWYRPDAE